MTFSFSLTNLYCLSKLPGRVNYLGEQITWEDKESKGHDDENGMESHLDLEANLDFLEEREGLTSLWKRISLTSLWKN